MGPKIGVLRKIKIEATAHVHADLTRPSIGVSALWLHDNTQHPFRASFLLGVIELLFTVVPCIIARHLLHVAFGDEDNHELTLVNALTHSFVNVPLHIHLIKPQR